MIAGVNFTRVFFKLHPGSNKSPQVVEFLKVLRAQIEQSLLIIWDALRAHRSRLVREYLDGLDGRICIEFLPIYSPELDPVECLWAWLKRHALENYCPGSMDQLAHTARCKLRFAQKRANLIAASWKQAELF